ncbi:EAL domain-containing protein [Lyngbya sp. CCY1209]|uniref:putative bifunctional diguanylate cyclase/phosphodiesterase n=1 Tax=Lyngbya sp. CCY1209 TaxID=2886103 RepID=UPI002D20E1AE|nr:EAL domain-containing protein [Lyngbya sp. CCY1209]MEB3884748.1 EAL domain-containing protein [Lyngbya sp. CCY1209]
MTKILVIEDEEPIRDLIEDLLTLEGFEIRQAADGERGIELAKIEFPDLIICDILMPNMDGYEVLSQLRSHPKTQNIPFIFLTAKGTRENQRRGMNLGADDYITKPFHETELLDAIRTRLRKHAALVESYQTRLASAEERLNELLYYDRLTKLPNQFLLRESFAKILREWDGEQKPFLPMLYLSLDRFQVISENLGFHWGNILLKLAAQKLHSVLPPQSVISCLNTNEFCIILSPFDSRDEIANFARTILDLFSDPFYLDNQEVFSTVSIGIACCTRDDRDLGQLLHDAKMAMHQVRKCRGNKYSFYRGQSPALTNREIVTLEADLHHAIERRELAVYYQPQFSLKTGQILGAEALLRWFHPTRGLISPAKFIPIAEETDLIETIGEWVFRTAVSQVKMWHDRGFEEFKIAVNLSPRQFNQADLEETIVQTIQTVGIAPDKIELELTENSLIENIGFSVQKLERLKSRGVQIAIDDFGTGYSSLSYLQQFPADVLKIDRSFINKIHQNIRNATITKSVIEMAHLLNLTAIAEGVETEAELEFLQRHGCDIVQGYIFSPPVSAAQLEALLKGDRRQ